MAKGERQKGGGGSGDAKARKALGDRIAKIADLYESRKLAAGAAGISTDQLQRYITGDGVVSFEAVSRMSGPKGASIDWVATGEGKMMLLEAKDYRETSKNPRADHGHLVTETGAPAYAQIPLL